MRGNRKLKWSMAVAIVVLAAGPAAAQSDGASTKQGDVSFQSSPSLAIEKMESEADAMIEAMKASASQIGRRQLKAASESDVVLALCLKDKLGEIDKAVASAKDRRSALRNPDIGPHEFTMIVVQKGNADRVSREAAQCIGKEGTTAGPTRVTTVIDKSLPRDESKYNFPNVDPPGMIVVSPPPPASQDR